MVRAVRAAELAQHLTLLVPELVAAVSVRQAHHRTVHLEAHLRPTEAPSTHRLHLVHRTVHREVHPRLTEAPIIPHHRLQLLQEASQDIRRLPRLTALILEAALLSNLIATLAVQETLYRLKEAASQALRHRRGIGRPLLPVTALTALSNRA